MVVLAIIVLIVALFLLAVVLVLQFNPVFGGRPDKERQDRWEQFPQFSKGKFANLVPTSPTESGFLNMLSILRDFIRGNPNAKPPQPIEPQQLLPAFNEQQSPVKVSWFGHSAVLMEIEGKVLFTDPMLGPVPSPIVQFGGKRYSNKLPIELDDLPAIDAFLISHDHYDHLDYGTIRRLHSKVKHFFVPLGVGAHLERWGVDRHKITELGWWQEAKFEGLTLTSAPARHYSGRGLSGRNSTLWCSWAIQGTEANVFFSGDSGYGPHFKDIGSRLGPFDLTLMECGQYDRRWSQIHMLPEQTVQAHLDVQGKLMMPIHWGAFTLALHDWTEPVERALAEAERKDVRLLTPRIGETVTLASYPTDKWWLKPLATL